MGLKPVNELLDAVEWDYVTVPYMLFRKYRELGLSDRELLVILQIMAYQQVEKRFPSLQELENRMELARDQIAIILQKLFVNQMIQQSEERISIRPLLEKMVGIVDNTEVLVSVFTRFEEEFGRLLSPLEYEQITRWLDEDNYPEWLIIEALRESVLAGVFNFRYVDTILREWEKAHITTEAQLAEHRQQHFRQTKKRPNQAGNRQPSGGETTRKEQSGANERVVPAAQPGKYERFYQVYKKNTNHQA